MSPARAQRRSGGAAPEPHERGPGARRAPWADHLSAHEFVADVRVSDLGGSPGAAVVPSDRGISWLRKRGWRGFAEELVSPALVGDVTWRFVESLAAYEDDAAVAGLLRAPLPRDPELVERGPVSAESLLLRHYVPLDIAICREHFPRMPIVPGVVQLSWAEAWAREYLGLRGRFVGLEAIKFQHIVQPGDLLDLHLQWRSAEHRLLLLQTSAAGRHAAGRLVFEPE